MKKAVLLLSGGLDSTTTLAIARAQGFEVYALSFNYGQKHSFELTAASNVAKKMGVGQHRIITIDLGGFGGSALTDDGLIIPKDRDEAQIGSGVPITYVPARNIIFLSFALAYAEVLKSYDIFIADTLIAAQNSSNLSHKLQISQLLTAQRIMGKINKKSPSTRR